MITKLFPVPEMEHLLESLGDEQLSETEAAAVERFRELLEGKWLDVGRV
jgi:hypothetical protein